MRCPVDELRRAGRGRLAAVLDQAWERTLAEHSAELCARRPRGPLEPALRDAFTGAMRRRGLAPGVVRTCLDDLDRHRLLQTATHLTVSEGPTFLAVHLAATAGLPPTRPYLVGAWSGVPFANPAWSGCLSYSDRHPIEALVPPGAPCYRGLLRDQRQRALDSDERRISLVPGRLRDARVHRCPMPERTAEIATQLTPALRAVLPPLGGEASPRRASDTSDASNAPLRTVRAPDFASAPENGRFFSDWALGACEAITAPLLGRTAPVVYLDLNEVIADYLRAVLGDGSHPLHRLLFDPALRERVLAGAGAGRVLFTAVRRGGKRERIAGLTARGERLEGPGVAMDLTPDTVVAGLAAGELCPGLLPVFAVLTFLDDFQCLGSFEQIDYLDRFGRALDEAGWPGPGLAARASTGALTTGRMLGTDGRPFYPLDAVLGTPFAPCAATTVGELAAPLLPRLLE